MNIFERAKNFLHHELIVNVVDIFVLPSITEIFRNNFGPEFPHFADLFRKTQLYFINADPLFEYPRPLMPNVIYVGGLTMENPEPLDSKWEQLISTERAKNHGVIIFSLGTVAKTEAMPMQMKKAFLDAFKRFPHQVIWRIEGKLPDMHEASNVHVTDWIPQKDLLGRFYTLPLP